ncbi:MAG: J domain-containing protein [Leptolyngbyaceae cyanobacterium]
MTNQETAPNHYTLLQVRPTASPQEIRRAYRDLSKLYHPDTTTLAAAIATEKFKVLNEAYATLSNPQSRLTYDYSIGISKLSVMQAPNYLNRPASERRQSVKDSAYLDPTDRPLSPGEMFALFILGVTFVGCLVLVFTVGWAKGTIVLHPDASQPAVLAAPPTPEIAPVSPSLAPAVDAEPPATAPPMPPLDETKSRPPLPSNSLSPKII